MSVVAISRGDVLIADQSGKAQLVSNGTSLAALVPIPTVPGGFGSSPFGQAFGAAGDTLNAAGDATVTPVTGLATLQTT